MMVEFLPFLLILLGWNPASPGETMVLERVLQADGDECVAEGEAWLRGEARAGGDSSGRLAGLPDGADYRYFCIPMPSVEDYDRAFEKLR